MTREKELEKVKNIIKEEIENADCGLYNIRNLVGDSMFTIFDGDYFTLDICYNWGYFEIFGTTKEEFMELYKFYDSLRMWNK